MNPTYGVTARMMAQMASVISLMWMMCLRPVSCTVARGVLPGVFCCQKCTTQQCRAFIRHAWGWLVSLCLIAPPFIPFFWVVNSNTANVATLRSVVFVVFMKTVFPQDRVVSKIRKGVMRDLDAVY